MNERGKPAVHESQVEMDIPFLGNCGERDYVAMLETCIRDHVKRYKRRLSILSDCLPSASYDSFPFWTCSGIWRGADMYEARHHSVVEEAYFLGWKTESFYDSS